MSDLFIIPRREEQDSRALWRMFEIEKFGLIGIAAIVGTVAGFFGNELEQAVSWEGILSAVSAMAVAFVIAAGLLRTVEIRSFRQRTSSFRRESEDISGEIQRRIGERFPEAAAAARETDASALIARIVDDDDKGGFPPKKAVDSERIQGK